MASSSHAEFLKAYAEKREVAADALQRIAGAIGDRAGLSELQKLFDKIVPRFRGLNATTQCKANRGGLQAEIIGTNRRLFALFGSCLS